MRQGFTRINLQPLAFDPSRVGVGQQLVGVAFAVEPHDEGAAIVVKASENAHAYDARNDRVVVVPPGFAVRVVLRGALARLLGKVIDPDTGAPRQTLPMLCFEVVERGGARMLDVGEAISSSVPGHAFTAPTLLDEGALIVVQPQAAVAPSTSAPTPAS